MSEWEKLSDEYKASYRAGHSAFVRKQPAGKCFNDAMLDGWKAAEIAYRKIIG